MVFYLAEHPKLQDRLRADRSLIALFIEEMLRLEGSSKVTLRLVRKNAHVGDMPVRAGTKIVLSLAGADRDPERWPDPNAFDLNRPRRAHLHRRAARARAMLDRLIEDVGHHLIGRVPQ